MKKLMTRRNFTKMSASAAAFLAVSPAVGLKNKNTNPTSIPLGAPVFDKYEDPEGWINALHKLGYRAAYSPVSIADDEATIKAYAKAAKKARIIKRAGAWIAESSFSIGSRSGKISDSRGIVHLLRLRWISSYESDHQHQADQEN